jgi:hypothetical protein
VSASLAVPATPVPMPLVLPLLLTSFVVMVLLFIIMMIVIVLLLTVVVIVVVADFVVLYLRSFVLSVCWL